jgi:hypothetical protein
VCVPTLTCAPLVYTEHDSAKQAKNEGKTRKKRRRRHQPVGLRTPRRLLGHISMMDVKAYINAQMPTLSVARDRDVQCRDDEFTSRVYLSNDYQGKTKVEFLDQAHLSCSSQSEFFFIYFFIIRLLHIIHTLFLPFLYIYRSEDVSSSEGGGEKLHYLVKLHYLFLFTLSFCFLMIIPLVFAFLSIIAHTLHTPSRCVTSIFTYIWFPFSFLFFFFTAYRPTTYFWFRQLVVQLLS